VAAALPSGKEKDQADAAEGEPCKCGDACSAEVEKEEDRRAGEPVAAAVLGRERAALLARFEGVACSCCDWWCCCLLLSLPGATFVTGKASAIDEEDDAALSLAGAASFCSGSNEAIGCASACASVVGPTELPSAAAPPPRADGFADDGRWKYCDADSTGRVVPEDGTADDTGARADDRAEREVSDPPAAPTPPPMAEEAREVLRLSPLL